MTAAPSPQASGYDDVVDLSGYPINDPADPRPGGPGPAGDDPVSRWQQAGLGEVEAVTTRLR